MPTEPIDLSDKDRQLFEQVAQLRGITLEEAVEQCAREEMMGKLRKKTPPRTAKVYELRKRKPN